MLAAIEVVGVDVTKLRRGLEGDATKRQSTIYEIEVAHLFVTAGFTDIVIEPPVPSSDKVADLLVRVGEDIYVEVEGWDKWSHHHHMYDTAARVEAWMEEQGYPPADIHIEDVRLHDATIIAALPKVADIQYGVPIEGGGFSITFVPPEEERHSINSTGYGHSIQNTSAISEAYPHLGVQANGAISCTDAVRERIHDGYEQVKSASSEFATLVIVRPSMGGDTVAEVFEDAVRGDRVHILEGHEEALAGTGDISLRAVRPLDEYEPPDGFQPTGLFNLEEYEGLSAAMMYRPPNFTGEQGVFVGIGNPNATHIFPTGTGEALCAAAKKERAVAEADHVEGV